MATKERLTPKEELTRMIIDSGLIKDVKEKNQFRTLLNLVELEAKRDALKFLDMEKLELKKHVK